MPRLATKFPHSGNRNPRRRQHSATKGDGSQRLATKDNEGQRSPRQHSGVVEHKGIVLRGVAGVRRKPFDVSDFQLHCRNALT